MSDDTTEPTISLPDHLAQKHDPGMMDTMELAFSRQGVDGAQSPKLTIRPRHYSEMHPSEREMLRAMRETWGHLPAVDVAESRQAEGELAVIGMLGSGGMGVVQVAEQRSLGREVALKTIRTDRMSAASVQALLREAELSGQLEHPNIIPVHALGRDDLMGPLLIMKRVEGVSWEELIDQVGKRSHAWLDRQLDILLSACNAVAFAHSRGIVHRDIKPANVMVGSFGEVYLLDWGVALRIAERDKEPPGILVGSPAYMAPEMLDGGARVTDRTDVFLLGATLHEVLVGRPRHTAASAFDSVLAVAMMKPFIYPEAVPAELAAICNRACAPDPERRYPNVAAFQDAIQSYRQRRGSLSVTRAAQANVKTLKQEIETSNIETTRPISINRLFSASRFGFQEALQVWPENSDAQEGLNQLLELMIDYEIQCRNAVGAKALLMELPERQPALEARIEALRLELESHAQAKVQLDTLEDEQRLTGATWGRTFAAIFSGVVWLVILVPLSWAIREGHLEGSREQGLGVALFWMALIMSSRRLLRSWLLENKIFAELMNVATIMPALVVLNHATAFLTPRTLDELLVSNYLIVLCCTATSAVYFDKALWLPATLMAFGTAFAAVYPAYALDLAGVLALGLNIWVAWLIRPTRSKKQTWFGL